MLRLKQGERRDDIYERDGVRWRCAWRYFRKDTPTEHTTTVYLRREADGPGRNTHTAHVPHPPDLFTPGLLDGIPFHPDPNPSFEFA